MMKLSFSIVCLITSVFIAGCAGTTAPSEMVPPSPQHPGSYSYHENNASTTAAKMIAPATF